MSYHLSPTIEKMIRDKMATGRYVSEEELLVLALGSLEAEEADLNAIEEALESVDQGDEGVTLDEAFKKLGV
jgi:Arc/MetJ-type ribon-helix-helix transcriptional regulator